MYGITRQQGCSPRLKVSSSLGTSQSVYWKKEREINQPFTMKMKGLAVLVLAIGITEAQLKFGGGSSSSSSSSGSQDTSTDTRFISSGNELIDGGILGVGAGLLGGAVLSGALNGGGNNNNYNSNYNNPCGRR